MPNLHGHGMSVVSCLNRALAAEDEGRLSRAVELYEALGRMDDVQRLLLRQKGGGDTNES